MSFRNVYKPYFSITTESIKLKLEIHTWIRLKFWVTINRPLAWIQEETNLFFVYCLFRAFLKPAVKDSVCSGEFIKGFLIIAKIKVYYLD